MCVFRNTIVLIGHLAQPSIVPQVQRAAKYAGDWLTRYLEASEDKIGVGESREEGGGRIDGPLSARVLDSDQPVPNAATFVFAGHDTTANTMTWLLFEVCVLLSLVICGILFL